MSNATRALERLWERAPPAERTFDPADVAHLPAAAQAYLAHAIARGTPLASAVRLRMHGIIKVGRWRHFSAEQVLVGRRATIWRASVRMQGLRVRGYDQLLDGRGSMQWRLLGVIPLIRASGPDVTRSAAGRVAAESIWLPSALVGEHVAWRADRADAARARFAVAGHVSELALAFDAGRLRAVSLARWGNPEGGAFRDVPFGAFVDQEETFGGYTIPARLRVGWHIDDPLRFEAEGKFFDVTVDDAVYR